MVLSQGVAGSYLPGRGRGGGGGGKGAYLLVHLDVQAIGHLVVLCRGETEMGAGEGCEVPETKDTGEVTERDKEGEKERGRRRGGQAREMETPTPGAGAQVPGEDARDASGALNAPFLE